MGFSAPESVDAVLLKSEARARTCSYFGWYKFIKALGDEINAALLYRPLDAQALHVRAYFFLNQHPTDLRSDWDALVVGNLNTHLRCEYEARATRFWPENRIYLRDIPEVLVRFSPCLN